MEKARVTDHGSSKGVREAWPLSAKRQWPEGSRQAENHHAGRVVTWPEGKPEEAIMEWIDKPILGAPISEQDLEEARSVARAHEEVLPPTVPDHGSDPTP